MSDRAFEFSDTSAELFGYLRRTEAKKDRTYARIEAGTELTFRQVHFSIDSLVRVDYVAKHLYDHSFEPDPPIKNPARLLYFSATELGEEPYRSFVSGRLKFYQALAIDLSEPPIQ